MVLPWTESLKKKISYSGHHVFYCFEDDDQENLAESKKPKKKRVCGISNMFRCSRHWLHLANPRRGAVLGVRLE